VTDIASLGIKVTTDGVQQAQADLDKLAVSGDKAAASTDKLSRANADAAKRYNSPQYRQQANDLAKLIGQIDPTVAALDRLDKQQAKLAAFKKSGMLSADDFKTYSNAIDEARAKVTSASHAVEKFTLNNSFARRELGRLVSDVANGNWGRFEQTAATLANSSGLLSAAFTGVGAAIAGAAVALGAFVVAAVKGREETDAYNKSLIVTGDYAGVTAGHLKDMAEAMATGSTTQHDAAKALAEVAASGKFTGQQLGLVGQAALDMAKLTGQSTAETIKQFASLQDEPVKAVLKLNESEHFLTEATYERIKALQDAGNVEEASTVAMKARSEALSQRAKEVQQNAGLMERAWNSVAGAAKAAWDAMLDVGREKSRGDQAQALQEQIDQLKGGRFLPNGMFQQGLTEDDPRIQALRKQISDLYDAEAKATKDARQKSLADQAVQAAAESDAEAALYATTEQRRVQEITAARAKANAAIEKALAAGDKATAERIRANEATILAGINEKYRDKKSDPFAESIGTDPRAALTASLQKEIDGYKKEAEQWARSTAAAAAYKATLQDMLATRQRAIDLQVASIGMGQREVAEQQALIAIDEDYNRKKADLQKRQQNATSELDREGYQAQLDALEQYHTDRIRMEQDGWRREDEARKSAALGARAAIKDFVYDAGDVAGQTHDLFTNAFDGMTDALAKFVTTGKLNFASLTRSILADLAKMEIRILASQALQAIFGGYGGTNGNGGVTYNSQGFVNHVYAKGGVVDGSANLSAFSGSVVDRPTLFAFAKGNGLMGEAGPEAILPLRRGPDGKLGVAAAGGGGGDVNLTQTFVIDGGATQTTSGAADDNVRKFMGRMKDAAREVVLEEQRPGGSLWAMRQPA
jgi:lambda family phage tail tape measure protein